MGDGTRRVAACAAGLAAAAAATLAGAPAHAGAWPQPAGDTLLILKFEGGDADRGFDLGGGAQRIPHLRDDDVALYAEHGITSRLTFQGQAAYTTGEDQFIRYSGAGQTQFGLRYTLLELGGGRTVASVYVGAIAPGQGRNADYALPNQGDWSGEFRVLVGHSWGWNGRNVFVDGQAARLVRSQLADETHVDLTGGIESGPWLLLLQNYDGEAETRPVSSRWYKVEAGVVRRFGPWRVQGGWRQTIAGRNTPEEGGPVVALWRRF